TKGRDNWGPILATASTAEATNRKRGLRIWTVAASSAKRELYDFLRLDPPTDAEWIAGRRYPAGYCHFPEYDEDFFKQLTAERLVVRHTRQGQQKPSWEKDPGQRNEVLDARVLARAGAALVGIERFRESDWRRLEAARGAIPTPPPPPPPATPAAPNLFTQPPPSAPPSRRGVIRSRFVGRFR